MNATHAGKPKLFAAAGLVAAYHLVGFGLAAALAACAAGIWLDRDLWGHGGLVGSLLLVGAAAVLVRGLVVVDLPAWLPEPHLPLDPAEEPALWAEVRTAALAVGAPEPDELVLVPFSGAFAGRRRGRAVVGVGMGLLAVLTVGELRAVLAHELHHLAAGDARLRAFVVRGRASMRRSLDRMDRLGRWLGLAAVARLVARRSAEVWRGQELAADEVSVRLCGRAATAASVEGAAQAERALDVLVERFVAPLWASGRRPADLYGGLHALLADPSFDTDVRADQTGPDADHPAPAARLGALAALPDPPVPGDDRSALALLRDAAGTQRALVERLSSAVTGAATTPTSWPDAAVLVYGPAREHAAAALGEAAAALTGAAAGLDQVLWLLGAGRQVELADRLQADVMRLPPGEHGGARRQALRAALHAAVSTHLVRRAGCRWVLSWSEVAVAGGCEARAAELWRLVDQAVDGPGGALALRRLVEAEPGD